MSEPEKKRLKLEIDESFKSDDDDLLKKILEYKNNQLRALQELYIKSQSELFYLENEGDFLQFSEWSKEPNKDLQAYLDKQSLPGLQKPKALQTGQVVTPVSLKVSLKTPGHSGPGRPSVLTPEQLAERAKHEAVIVQRIVELQREGLWSEKRLPKVAEPQRLKTHWDYLLEEVHWLAADFVQERKWKLAAARKCARMVQKYFQEKEQAALKAEKEQETKLRKIASFVAREVRQFWKNVEKVSEYKQNLLLEEKRKKMLNQQLNLIVQQTEEFSSQLAETMQGKVPETPPSSKRESDIEFEPEDGSTDDEETIDKEEKDMNISSVAEEIDYLKKESEIPLEDLLDSLPPGYLDHKIETPVDSGSDFEADESSDDDEATLDEQEENEPVVDHKDEIKELEAEQNLPIEDLLKKYSDINSEEYQKTDISTIVSDDESETEMSDSDSESKLVEEMNIETPEMEIESKDVGLEALLGINDTDDSAKERRTKLSEAVELAEAFQPKGNTLASAEVNVQVPFLLKHTLREYQLIGLNWLATMYERQLNGILADEMGLGKTIQTISLLAWLACDKGIWGPHLIIVPTSVMLNWEMECKKWCPSLKVLVYYGSGKERKFKRTGWTKPNAFHVCITSYKLVVQDHAAFRRKQWQYIILDEAQNIKNFKSQRWQLLLNFSSQRRLLLTGTPLQNNLMELWSLMHFLMPSMFASHKDFREWFSNPVTGMIEGNSEYNESIIKRLHKVLRPFLLRRLKCEVEKQLPSKYEHIVMCRLSKRQRYLYDDYMSKAKTRETLTGGNLLSVINVLMQLRKVCAHPNLFEPRPTVSPFQMRGIVFNTASCVVDCLNYDPFKHVNLGAMNLLLPKLENLLTAYAAHRTQKSQAPVAIIQNLDNLPPLPPRCPSGKIKLVIKPQTTSVPGQSVMIPRPGISAFRAVPTPPPSGIRDTTPQPLLASPAPILPSPPVSLSGGEGLTARQPIIPSSTEPNRTNGHLLQIPRGSNQTGNGEQRLSLSLPPSSTLPQTPIRIITSVNRQPSISEPSVSDETKPHLNGEGRSVQPDKPYIDPSLQYDKITLTRNNTVEQKRKMERKERLVFLAKLNKLKSAACPVYGEDVQNLVSILPTSNQPVQSLRHADQPWSVSGSVNVSNAIAFRGLSRKSFWSRTTKLENLVRTPEELAHELTDILTRFTFVVPGAMAPFIKMHASHTPPSRLWCEQRREFIFKNELTAPGTILHTTASAMMTQFPDPRLIQYDCGKLQVLDRLLRDLKVGKHRVLIFTQMTRMLDVLESFLTFHGHTYLRLDGSTKIDQRQALMERFNSDKRIFCFILSTRSGGIGVNLTGADTVVFYDSDWNPTMDAQAQDRCHRIGQTRDVHIYRLISEKTIEENILKKANQKRLLGDLAIEGGNFTTAYFQKQTIRDLFEVDVSEADAAKRLQSQRHVSSVSTKDVTGQSPQEAGDKSAVAAWESALQAAEDESDVTAAKKLRAEVAADQTEFDESAPLDEDEPKSKAEAELEGLIGQLNLVERYALRFIEADTNVAQQLAEAEEELEERKRQWEINRAEAAKKAAQKEDVLTYPRSEQVNKKSGSLSSTPRTMGVRSSTRQKLSFSNTPKSMPSTPVNQTPLLIRKKRLVKKKEIGTEHLKDLIDQESSNEVQPAVVCEEPQIKPLPTDKANKTPSTLLKTKIIFVKKQISSGQKNNWIVGEPPAEVKPSVSNQELSKQVKPVTNNICSLKPVVTKIQVPSTGYVCINTVAEPKKRPVVFIPSRMNGSAIKPKIIPTIKTELNQSPIIDNTETVPSSVLKAFDILDSSNENEEIKPPSRMSDPIVNCSGPKPLLSRRGRAIKAPAKPDFIDSSLAFDLCSKQTKMSQFLVKTVSKPNDGSQ
ncbi:hypothetical protein QYM36_011990 [Artemia franciscana]|uniref:Helicase domino n=1 Tax=Artemia franciscana TaxID=6661 RepID=A0AA88L2U8_ARTSF|nr:hypothetical protein QYM36_011990 [Artemia franciscana]